MTQNCTNLTCSRNCISPESNYAYPEHQVHQNDEEFDDRTARIHCDTFLFRLSAAKFSLANHGHSGVFFYYHQSFPLNDWISFLLLFSSTFFFH